MIIDKINFSKMSADDIASHIVSKPSLSQSKLVTFLDAASIVRLKKNTWYREYLAHSDFTFADGYYVYKAARTLGTNIKEQVTGYDVTTKILASAKTNNIKIYFLGAETEVLKNLIENVKSKYGDIVAGYHDGYYKDDELCNLIQSINDCAPDIILVGIGYPKRELFISMAHKKFNGRFIVGVGGVFDILGGKTKRAPAIIIKMKAEWLYRAALEPKRMWKRIAFDYPLFCRIFAFEWVTKKLQKH